MGRRAGRILLAAVVAALFLLVLGRIAVGFYTDILWYESLGYLSTYWTRFWLGVTVRAAAAVLGTAVVFLNLWWVARHLGPIRVRRRYGNLEIAERIPRKHVLSVAAFIAVLGGWWLAELQFDDAAVLTVMSWLRHVPWGVTDPLFGHDVAFYVFGLPVLASVMSYLILVTVWTIALVALGHVLVGGIQWNESELALTGPARRHLGVLVAALLVLLGVRYWLSRYGLVVDGSGIAGSLGFTDVEARLPVYSVMALLAVGAAASVVYGAWRVTLLPPVVGLGVLLVGGLLLTAALPAVVQKLRVEPNELSRESRYIRWNMEYTRRAYGLDGMARQAFPYRRAAPPDPATIEALLARLPLWDRAPLERTFNEIQTLFQYYWFPDVDFDRYGEPGRELQVGIGVREFQATGLDASARTWQSLRLNPAYIRGMGAVVAPARSPGGESGAPALWVRNVNPLIVEPTAPATLRLDRPSVFYGESTSEYAIVVPGRDGAFTGQPGTDYPVGVPLSSFFRVMAFAWRFGDETLLFSGDVTRDSRMLFHRSVRSRLEELAPFVVWDPDLLPVIRDGSIVWLVDGYTTSASYPLSRPVTLGRNSVRYLRNSVKAVVDAITGEVTLYAMGADPILATYRRIFPDLVRPMDDMPPALRRHLRFPELALRIQSEILQEYHVQRPEAFYAGQDVWQRSQGSAPDDGIQEYRPFYGMMPEPLGAGTAYLAALPFIARSRRNMTALLVARHEPERYGELTLFEFPRDQQVPGPEQVQAVIEQDAEIARELSLLRQRGSGVDLGQLRVIPLDSTVLYVQPLFLSADENPIPELWRVVVSNGRDVTMARTLEAALAALQLPGVDDVLEAPAEQPEQETGWSREALDLLERANARLREGDWAGYGRLMNELRSLLEQVNREAAGPGP